MAVTSDAISTINQFISLGSSPYTHTGHTIGSGSNQVLIVRISTNATSISMTWNGNSMTDIGTTATPDSLNHVHTFYLVAPTQGNQNLVITWSGGGTFTGLVSVVESFNGVNQATPISSIQAVNNQASSPIGVTVTSSVSSIVLDACVYPFGLTTVSANSGQTVEYNNGAGSDGAGFATITGTASYADSWTASGHFIQVGLLAFSVDPPASPPATGYSFATMY